MLSYILNVFKSFFDSIMSLFGFENKSLPPSSTKLQVFVKTNVGEKVCVHLDPTLTVADLKVDVAAKLSSSINNIKIIFAGKELHDSLVINECDIGNRSILHAVRVETIKSRLLKEREGTSKSSLETAICNSTLSEKIKPAAASSSSTKLHPAIAEIPDEQNKVIKKNLPKLLCDPSTVLSIQLTEEELRELQKLKASEREKPHFYVYCTVPCASVQIGKLRVRCWLCKNGALTVHRDPSNWKDVLIPQQIGANCENPDCEGSFAEFYFKCCNHETTGEDDTVVVLYLLRANFPGVPCLACTDVSSPIIVFECINAHVMCLDCFVTYCISRLNERQFVSNDTIGYTLPCPVGCSDSLVKEVHHFKLMGDQQYDRYQRFGAEEAVLTAGGVFCPTPGCGQGIIPDSDCRRVKCLNGCEYVFCKDCLQGYHIGECVVDDPYGLSSSSSSGFTLDPNRVALSSWDEASKVTIRVITKPCPKCRTPTERDGGCMHMVCTRQTCQFNWCWVCQTEWTRDCMSAHWFG